MDKAAPFVNHTRLGPRCKAKEEHGPLSNVNGGGRRCSFATVSLELPQWCGCCGWMVETLSSCLNGPVTIVL